MRLILILFLFTLLVTVNCNDEYITIWAPNKVFYEKYYNVVLLSKNIDKRTEVAIQFGRNFETLTLASDKVQKVNLRKRHRSGQQKYFDLLMTLHRNVTSSTGYRQMCVTQKLQTIEADKRKFYTFIQTDKPVYKPGDTVKFRIVIVDRDLRPFHLNNINIKITDSMNRIIKEFDDLMNGDENVGVFARNFTLTSKTSLGTWKIRAVIDKRQQFSTYKNFVVQSFSPLSLTAYLTLDNLHLLPNSNLKLSFYAKNQDENFVKGNAKITVKSITKDQVIILKTFDDVEASQDYEIEINKDLKAETGKYEVSLNFTEPESGIWSSKSMIFTVHPDTKSKFQVTSSEHFIPEQPFHLNVIVYDWKDSLVEKSLENVNIKYEVQFQNRSQIIATYAVKLKDGIAEHNYLVPENAQELSYEINYVDVTVKKTIKPEASSIGFNKLYVDFHPKNPQHGDVVDVFVRFNSKIDQLIANVMSRHGIIDTHHIYCGFKLWCRFNTTISKDMMSQAKILVYYVNDKNTVYQGEAVIVTEKLGINKLDVDLVPSASTSNRIDIKFKTKPKSKVYLLGYDKRFKNTLLKNDFTYDDVFKGVSDYDGSVKTTVFDISQANWNECTPLELSRIKNGRTLIGNHSGMDDFIMADSTDDDSEEFQDFDSELENKKLDIEENSDAFSEDFLDSWIFDEFEVPNGKITKTFTTPSLSSSWIISTFSMNKRNELAISPQKEIVVKDQFFAKIVLPNSIKFKEILCVDVMLHNYIDSKEPLNVNVTIDDHMKNNSFRFYNNTCSSIVSNDVIQMRTERIPNGNSRRVSFYIQAGTDKQEFETFLNIRINIIGITPNGNVYRIMDHKKLKVEPVGVKTYRLHSMDYNFKRTDKTILLAQNITDVGGYSKLRTRISGDFLSSDMNFEFQLYPESSLEQVTSTLKANVEFLLYFKSRNRNQPEAGFSEYYQRVLDQREQNWNYKNSTGFSSYFVDIIAYAMRIDALPVDKEIIKKELDKLKSNQMNEGNFKNFGSFPDSKNEFFRTAFILIPFLKFKNYFAKNYDDVINNGFNYLSGIDVLSELDKEAYSIAALAYALNNKHDQAEKLLREIEMDVVRIDKTKKCFKLSRNHKTCSLRQTAYATLAYINMNKLNEAKALVAYILGEFRQLKELQYTYEYALATEAIVKFLIYQPIRHQTDLSVTISNELNFEKVVNFTTSNQNNIIEIVFPDYTLQPKLNIKGTGFISIMDIDETIVKTPNIISKFDMSVKNIPSYSNKSQVVQVCAKYQPSQDEGEFSTLFSVIYNVEMPSGYIFEKIVNMEKIPEIKMVEPQANGTRVQIYFNDFEQGKNYCADIKASKLFDVKHIQTAGVMVYASNDKNNIAINFYKFPSEC